MQIPYTYEILPNGLRVIHHQDVFSKQSAVSLLYQAGSRYDPHQRTGMAHLFEHLMYTGTRRFSSYDKILQLAGGDGNAFTNQDIAYYYALFPAVNLSSYLELEGDRMTNLRLSQRGLDTQRKVVIEEWKETCLDEPFGDVLHVLCEAIYEDHPYRWPVIGYDDQDIRRINRDDVAYFYQQYYQPGQTILAIAGPQSWTETRESVLHYFGSLAGYPVGSSALTPYNYTKGFQEIIKPVDVSQTVIFIAFMMPGRRDTDYAGLDFWSQWMSQNISSPLYQDLIKKRQWLLDIDVYLTGGMEHGQFMIEAHLLPDSSVDKVLKRIWWHLDQVKNGRFKPGGIQAVKHKRENAFEFQGIHLARKLSLLSESTWLGYPEAYLDYHRQFMGCSISELLAIANKYFVPEQCVTLIYEGK